MSKNDLDLSSIEELAALRENATDRMLCGLEAELEKSVRYDRLTWKSQAGPVAHG